ncbi:DUF2147 domain-containing protein [Hufsiella ginkgonis]|uniref:DUF2147 domain-containing protein n=1 Tax=Hufsiella ginkgonis TaxID=2695274 RepID=A0A7K1XUS7_9SPHI|nr:DUF2147 domain-containing protein [Hufsiella ginkgonis]MXV14765.1 DUF2147 domain-containing protein [Hufsiella ginkgonis]
MKRSLFLLVLLLTSFAPKKNPVLGKWENPKGDGRMEIITRNNKFYGKLYWLKEPNLPDGTPKMDINNPDPKLQKRHIQGLEIIHDLVDKGNGVFEDGFVYEPKTAKDFNCRLELIGDKLQMQGFIGTPLLGRTELWTRVK